LIGVQVIAIQTHAGAAPAAHKPRVLELMRRGQVHRVAPSQLEKLAPAAWRVGRRTRPGSAAWLFADVVALAGGEVTTVRTMAVTDGDGTVTELPGEWLAGSSLLIGMDASGVFKLKKIDDSGQTERRVRDVRRVELIE